MPEKPAFRQDSTAEVAVGDGDDVPRPGRRAFGSEMCWRSALAATRLLQGQVW